MFLRSMFPERERQVPDVCWLTEHLLKKDTHDKTMISNDDKDKDKEEPRNDQETSGSCNTDVSIDEGILLQPFIDLIQTYYIT